MYRLSSRIETGALAELVRGQRDGTPVVLKLFFEKTTDEAYARVIAGYAQRLRTCTHRGVGQSIDLGLVQRRLALVRHDLGRFTLGDALKRLHTREVFLPPALALAIVIELLEALQIAHTAGVVHGALTPGNIVIADAGYAVITDFGALEALRASPALRAMFSNQGRSSYRAPELKGTTAATESSDLYSMGAICYELLTLHEASTGGAAVSTRQEKLPPPSRLARRLNSRIDGAVMRALEASPARRFKSCSEFAEALRDAAAANGGLSGPDELKKFTASLFPNEVVFSESSEVPFTEAFTLAPVEGASALPADVEAAEPPALSRRSFSLGVVRAEDVLPEAMNTRPTELEMALVEVAPGVVPEPRAEPTTNPEALAVIEAVQQWHAPTAAKAVASQTTQPQLNDTIHDLGRRVRAVEDFAGERSADEPESERLKARKAPEAQRIPSTKRTFTTPFQRTDVPLPPDFKAARERAERREKQAKQTGLALLVITVGGLVVWWLMSTVDKTRTLISYLPTPIERVLVSHAAPDAPESATHFDADGVHAVGAPTDTKAPDLRPKPIVVPPVPKDAKAKPKGPDTPKGRCFVEDSGDGHAVLSIDPSVPVKVSIDGLPVCGATNAISVKPGAHFIDFTDAKGRKKRVSQFFTAGRSVRLLPEFE